MEKHLPILITVVPLFGGIAAVLCRGFGAPWSWSCLVTGGQFVVSILLLDRVIAAPQQVLSYAVGDWPAPWGIECRIDAVNGVLLVVVAGIGLLATVYSRLLVSREIDASQRPFFYSLWLFCLTGLGGIAITGDAFNMYVLLEISSLTTYALIAMGKERSRRALTAAFEYLILGSIGASFILIGIGYLYMVTGTLNMADMSARLADIRGSRTVLTAFAFVMVGLSIKMGLFPLHLWLPRAYTHAPSAVATLLAATATKVGIYMSFRFIFTIFGTEFCFGRLESDAILIACACAAILFGSFRAVQQDDMRTLLAFSSVAQIGYIVLGFSLNNALGVTASVVHIINHALMKGGMFMAVGVVVYHLGTTNLRGYRGLGRRMPLTMAAFTIGGLGLIGVPLTAGFVSKWFLLAATLERGLHVVAAVVLVGSLLAALYVWRVVEQVYFQPPDDDGTELSPTPLSLAIPLWLLIGSSLYFGIRGIWTSEVASRAAAALLGT